MQMKIKLYISILLLTTLVSKSSTQVNPVQESSLVLNQLMPDVQGLLGSTSKPYLTEIQTSVPQMSIGDIKDFNSQEVTLKTRINNYYVSLCNKYAQHEVNNGAHKAQFNNQGCSLLFQNVNNGMDEMIIAHRLTSWAIDALNRVHSVLKNSGVQPSSSFFTQQNETVMSILHSNVENCKFSLTNADCMSVPGSQSSFYVKNYKQETANLELSHQQSISQIQNNSSQFLRNLFLEKSRNLETHAGHYLCFRSKVQNLDWSTQKMAEQIFEYSVNLRNYKSELTGKAISRANMGNYFKRTRKVLTEQEQKYINFFKSYDQFKTDFPQEASNYKIFLINMYKTMMEKKQCFNNIKTKFRETEENPDLPGFLVLQYCSDAELSFINYSLDPNANQCSELYKLPFKQLFKSEKALFYKQYKLEFFQKLFEEKELMQHYKSQLRLKFLNILKKIQNARSNSVLKKRLQLEFLSLSAKNTYILNAKKMPSTSIAPQMAICKKAHPNKQCVDVKQTNFPFDNAMSGATVACNKYSKYAWTKQSYQCQIGLKEVGGNNQVEPNVISIKQFGIVYSEWMKKIKEGLEAQNLKITDQEFQQAARKKIMLGKTTSYYLQEFFINKMTLAKIDDKLLLSMVQKNFGFLQQLMTDFKEFMDLNKLKCEFDHDWIWLKGMYQAIDKNQNESELLDKLAKIHQESFQRQNPGVPYEIINHDKNLAITLKKDFYDPLYHTPYQWSPSV